MKEPNRSRTLSGGTRPYQWYRPLAPGAYHFRTTESPLGCLDPRAGMTILVTPAAASTYDSRLSSSSADKVDKFLFECIFIIFICATKVLVSGSVIFLCQHPIIQQQQQHHHYHHHHHQHLDHHHLHRLFSSPHHHYHLDHQRLNQLPFLHYHPHHPSNCEFVVGVHPF